MERMGDSMDAILRALEAARKAQEEYEAKHPKEVAEWRQREAEKLRKDRLRPYRARKIPPEIASLLDSGNLPPLKVEDALRERLANGKLVVVLCGRLGTGKTIAACRWLVGCWDSLYVKLFEFAAWSDHMDRDRPLIAEVRDVESLVIDECSLALDKDQIKLETLLHHRIDYGKQTIVIIDKSPSEALDHLGERIASRIWEVGSVIPAKQVVRQGEIKRQQRSRK